MGLSIKYKKVDDCDKKYDNINPPQKACLKDAAWDIFTPQELKIDLNSENRIQNINTGLRFKLPEEHYGKLETKSSYAVDNFSIEGGIIDEGYTGEIIVILNKGKNRKGKTLVIEEGAPIAQMTLHQVINCTMEETEESFGTPTRKRPIDVGIESDITVRLSVPESDLKYENFRRLKGFGEASLTRYKKQKAKIHNRLLETKNADLIFTISHYKKRSLNR